MKIALLCSGLGNIRRGHEVFARDLFALLSPEIDITLFKGGGASATKERVIDNVSRNAAYLEHIHIIASPKWRDAIKEHERNRIECETFAYGSLKPLLEGEFDVIHCLERDVCNIVYKNRHLFRRIPKILFSNGGAIPARELPSCDFVQEHTERNLKYSARGKSFMIPHGVDMKLFHPEVVSEFRAQHDIPEDAFVIISVGAISHAHKRMDYVIKEVAALEKAYLIVVGQETKDTPEIKVLGKSLMGKRIIFAALPHDRLPEAYAAANVFTLGSVFETFGIVYVEAMAMGLPVICSNHINQQSIVKEGIFIDMKQIGALASVLRHTDRASLAALGKRGREIALQHYDLNVLKCQYVERYHAIASAAALLPKYSLKKKLVANARNSFQRAADLVFGRSE